MRNRHRLHRSVSQQSENGTPTQKDHNQAWPDDPQDDPVARRAASHHLCDQPRRRLDHRRDPGLRSVRGRLSSEYILGQDRARPGTGRFVGVNVQGGVFSLDPSETQFTKLYDVSKDTLRHPYSVEYIPRFHGFVISDASGLHLLDRAGALNPLPIVNLTETSVPFPIFDLPAFDGLLVNASIQGPAVVVRYDDGRAIVAATLKQFDFVKSVKVEIDGSISVATQFDHRQLRLNRTPRTPIIQGQSFAMKERLVRSGTTRIEARGIGKLDLRASTGERSSTTTNCVVPFGSCQRRKPS